jgi:hypothetical protein
MSDAPARPADIAKLAATIERAAAALTVDEEPARFIALLEDQGEEPR